MDKYLSHLAQPGDTLKISKTGWMLSLGYGSKTSPSLRNVFNGKNALSDDGYQFSDLDLESGLAVAEKATHAHRKIEVMNPDDQRILLQRDISLSTAVAWSYPSQLVLLNEHQVQVFDCSQSHCVARVTQAVARRPQRPDPNNRMTQGLLLIQQDPETYKIVDTRKPTSRVYAFSWKGSEGYVPKSLQLETRNYFVGMAFKKGAEGDQDPRQFLVRKSDGKVIIPSYSDGAEYLLSLSQNGHWGVLGQIYEPGGPLSVVELDANLKIGKRVALGNQVISTAPSCSDLESFYFLAKDPQSGPQSQAQYYRLSDEGVSKAPLLSDEVEVKSGCREEMVTKTVVGERLRKWGNPTPLFESARVDFLAPNPDEKEIRWVISAPLKDFNPSELYDLSSRAGGSPVLTGLLSPPKESDDPPPSLARAGTLISVGQDRLIWVGN